MKASLGFGRGNINVDLDDSRFEVLAHRSADLAPLTDGGIGTALDSPIGSPPLHETISPGESVLIVVSDATRASASAQVVNLIVRRLIESGVSPIDIRIIFATGIHRPVTTDEKRSLLTPFIAERIRTIDHDAYDQNALISLGTTPAGTPIEVNRALREHDHVIVTGGISFHYFAGFSGGRKSICPGLASARTIEATHMVALDFDRGGRRVGVASGRLGGNAVHEECERVAAMINPSFLVNTVVAEDGSAQRIYAGDWKAAHRKACEEYLEAHSREIGSKRDVVIASCGGWPYDINMIQAHKSLDMAAHACVDGGAIILLAECAEGLGRADFLKWFDSASSSELEVRLRREYEVNGQTAWALMTKAERFRVVLVSSLPEDDVRKMRMIPARDLPTALSMIDTGANGFIMPRAASVLPLIADTGSPR